MAQRQLQRRHDYEQAQVDTVLQTNAIAIGKANADDIVTFEAARQDGLDLIDKMGLDSGIRQQKVKDWFSTAAKARFEALIAKDPKQALAMFGLAQAGSETKDDTAEAVGLENAGSTAASKGDGAAKLTPDERVAQAFHNDNSAHDNGKAALKAAPWIADLSPDALRDLGQKAQTAMTVQLIETRAKIDLASENAPTAIAGTGVYSGKMPRAEDFIAIYGADEGGKQFQDFSRKIDVGRQAFDMRTMSNRAVHVQLRDAEPGPGGPPAEQARYQVTAAAAIQTLGARRVDPGGYVRKVFPNVDAAWGKIGRPDSGSWNRRGEPDSYDPSAYENAIAASVAAQKQLGIESFQPLPWSVVQNIVATFNDESVPQADKDTILRSLWRSARPQSSDCSLSAIGPSWASPSGSK
ncbi:hypothetical protein [Mesorhizobium metallidurans]|nr:hypothetical protein [Mesorhizobium metallidurans]